ncbi:MAG: hypothetical protein Q9198_008761 [Flavoplaca austrocitrina]
MSRRAPALGVDHVIEFLLVGSDAHASRVFTLLREHGEEDGGVAKSLRFAILHAFREDARKFLRRELEVEEGTDGDAAFCAFVERRGAEGNGGGERHAPECNSVRVHDRKGAEVSEGVGIVGGLLHWIDVVAWMTIAFAKGAGIVDEGGDVGQLVLFRDFRDEHFLDAVELEISREETYFAKMRKWLLHKQSETALSRRLWQGDPPAEIEDLLRA